MKIYSIFLLLLLLFACDFSSINEEGEEAQKAEKRRQEEERIRVEKLEGYVILSDSLYNEGAIEQSIVQLDSALLISTKETGKLSYRKAGYLFKVRQYELSTEWYQASIDNGFKKDTCYYIRALCYEKLRDRQSALNDLKRAINLGHDDADKLHDRINPERRKISGYNIRCCDGSISYSTSRRGTCSHHGGVSNWNEPVYETYRKY
ncbi:DUF3761 domain-containing protein [Crocinitomicaceae bacterium]|nr:DUF3761 domain-containing protein [Crocinitomicaceae bacterium]MDC0257545.1 DUF3761 domain-containing protein [Crocinitomicaceae bacterium]